MDGFRPPARSAPGAPPFSSGSGPAPRIAAAKSSDFDPQPHRFENQHTLKIKRDPMCRFTMRRAGTATSSPSRPLLVDRGANLTHGAGPILAGASTKTTTTAPSGSTFDTTPRRPLAPTHDGGAIQRCAAHAPPAAADRRRGTRAAAARDSRQAATRRLIFEVLALKTVFRDMSHVSAPSAGNSQ